MTQKVRISSRTGSLILILLYDLTLIAALCIIMIHGKSMLGLSLVVFAAILGIAGWLLARFAGRHDEEQEEQKTQAVLYQAIHCLSWLVYAAIAVCMMKQFI